VVSERPIERSEVILRARVIGGIKLLDRGEADDKIIGVLEGDYVWDHRGQVAPDNRRQAAVRSPSRRVPVC
jgi:inorganic pyrophosphatase